MNENDKRIKQESSHFKTVCTNIKADTYTNENTIDSPEINSIIYGQLSFNKD